MQKKKKEKMHKNAAAFADNIFIVVKVNKLNLKI